MTLSISILAPVASLPPYVTPRYVGWSGNGWVGFVELSLKTELDGRLSARKEAEKTKMIMTTAAAIGVLFNFVVLLEIA